MLPISFDIKEEFSSNHELILHTIPLINSLLSAYVVSAYVVYIANKFVSIKVMSDTPSLVPHKVSKVYLIEEINEGIIIGSGWNIYYKHSIYARKCFSMKWNKNIGLFTESRGKIDYFPAHKKGLTKTLHSNYRRLWNVKGK